MKRSVIKCKTTNRTNKWPGRLQNTAQANHYSTRLHIYKTL